MRVYVAGPIFTPRERELLSEIGAHLRRRGHSAFVPAEVAGPPVRRPSAAARRRAFEANVRSLEEAELVVAVLDGADADSGTAFEAGMAFARGTPVVGIRTDYRTLGNEGRVNLMLEQGCAAIVARSEGNLPALLLDLDAALSRPVLPPQGKLVRDRIPGVIRAQGRTARTRRAPGSDRGRWLSRKVIEEAGELSRAATARDRARELCDLWEALAAYAKLHGIGVAARRMQIQRRERLGGFERGVVLTSVSAWERRRR